MGQSKDQQNEMHALREKVLKTESDAGEYRAVVRHYTVRLRELKHEIADRDRILAKATGVSGGLIVVILLLIAIIIFK